MTRFAFFCLLALPLAAAPRFAQPGERYVVYLRQGATATVPLAAVNYAVTRFDPRTGQALKLGHATGGGAMRITPAVPDTKNWASLIERRP